MPLIVRLLSLLGVVVPLGVVGLCLARWSHPQGPRLERLVAGIVWATSTLVLAGMALGALGLFRLGWILAVLVGLAVATLAWASTGAGARADGGRHGRGGSRVTWALTGGVVALLGAQWANSAYLAMRTGMTDPDSQHYHLTHAARFVQSGEVFGLHRVSAGDLAAFHPNNDELIRAVGMAATRSEASGLVWVAVTAVLALAAAAAVSRQWGRGPAVVAATAVVLVLPGGARQYAGSAANDWAAIALLLAAIALWSAARSPRELVPAGLAAGLALGTKLSLLAPVGGFLVVAVALPHAVPRVARGVAIGAAAVATGVWWFVRNWIAVGTPVPGLGLPLLDDPAAPLLEEGARSVLHYATDPGVIRDWYLPGLAWSLGPLWWLVLAIVVAGIVLGLRGFPAPSSRGAHQLPRLLAIVSAISVVAYLLTPTGAAGPPGEPVLFQFNVRYLLPAVVTATWAVALRVPARAAAAVAAGMVVVTLLPASSWDSRSPAWLVVAVLAGVAGAAVGAARWRPSMPLLVAGCVLGVAVVAGPVAALMVQHRYSGGDARSEVLAVGRSLGPTDAVGVVGFPLHYAYTGPALETRVEYIGRLRDDGAFVDHASCERFLQEVDARGLTHVAVLAFPDQPAPSATQWLDRLDAATVVAESDAGRVFRIDGPVDSLSCEGG